MHAQYQTFCCETYQKWILVWILVLILTTKHLVIRDNTRNPKPHYRLHR